MKMIKIKTTCLFLCSSIILFSQGMQLSIPIEQQMKSQWCWAASAKMIDTYFRGINSRGQCDVVDLYMRSIRNDPTLSALCNQIPCGDVADIGDYDLALDHNGISRGMSRVLSLLGYYSSIEYKVGFDWAQIVNEIDNCRPLILFITEQNDPLVPGHIVVIYGYNVDQATGYKYLLVNDPNRCSPAYSQINFTNSSLTNVRLKIVAFQTNICLRGSFCSPCEEKKKPSAVERSSQPLSNQRTNYFKINQKIINIESQNQDSTIFYKSKSFHLYDPEAKKAIEYEVIGGKELEMGIKTGDYAREVKVQLNGQTKILGYQNVSGMIPYSIARYPLPYSSFFYEFKDPINNKLYYVPNQNVYDPNDKNKVIFKSTAVYTQSQFKNNILYINKKIKG